MKSKATRRGQRLAVVAIAAAAVVALWIGLTGDGGGATPTVIDAVATSTTEAPPATSTTNAPETSTTLPPATTTIGETAPPDPLGIYLIPVAGGDATWIANGTAPAWSPAGDQIAFEGPDGIYTIPTSGGEATYVATGTAPAWSPAGDQIVFEGQI